MQNLGYKRRWKRSGLRRSQAKAIWEIPVDKETLRMAHLTRNILVALAVLAAVAVLVVAIVPLAVRVVGTIYNAQTTSPPVDTASGTSLPDSETVQVGPSSPVVKPSTAVGDDKSNARPTGKPSKLKKIALIVGREFIPDTQNECKGARNALAARLEAVTEFEPDEDGLAAIVAAKVIADVAGYEFDPILVLGKGDKPSDRVKDIPATIDALLLVRVSTRDIPGMPIGTVLITMADAALYNKSGKPIMSAGWSSIEVLDATKIKDGKVDTMYWRNTAAGNFYRNFAPKVLQPMQAADDADSIASEIARLRSARADDIKPAVTKLPLDTWSPRLKVSVSAEGSAVAYLENKAANWQMRWFGGNVDAELSPGKYVLFVEVTSKSASRVLKAEFDLEDGSKYTFEAR